MVATYTININIKRRVYIFFFHVSIIVVGGYIFKYTKGKKTNKNVSISSLHNKTHNSI